MTDLEKLELIKSKLDKNCINMCPAVEYTYDGKNRYYPYRRNDLDKWSKEAFERGEKYFYVEPVNPDNPNGVLKLSDPKYVYKLTLNQEEFDNLFN